MGACAATQGSRERQRRRQAAAGGSPAHQVRASAGGSGTSRPSSSASSCSICSGGSGGRGARSRAVKGASSRLQGPGARAAAIRARSNSHATAVAHHDEVEAALLLHGQGCHSHGCCSPPVHSDLVQEAPQGKGAKRGDDWPPAGAAADQPPHRTLRPRNSAPDRHAAAYMDWRRIFTLNSAMRTERP